MAGSGEDNGQRAEALAPLDAEQSTLAGNLRSLWRRSVAFFAQRKTLAAVASAATVAAVVVVVLWTSGILAGGDDKSTEDAGPGASPSSSSQVRFEPPGTTYPVTALPGPQECSRLDATTEQAQGDTSAIEAAAMAGVVRIVSDIASGSGFAVDSDGTLVTDSRVVEGSWLIKVHLTDGEQLDARLLGISEALGIAFIEVSNTEGLAAIPMGDSDDVCVGDDAYVVEYEQGVSNDSVVQSMISGRISSVRGNYLGTDLSPGLW